MSAPLPDLSACAREPIRVPGAIQPHGWMVVVTPAGEPLAWSANWRNADRAAEAAQRVRSRLPELLDGDGPAALGTVELDGRLLDALQLCACRFEAQ